MKEKGNREGVADEMSSKAGIYKSILAVGDVCMRWKYGFNSALARRAGPRCQHIVLFHVSL